jgi:hypothetical protein
VTAPEELRDLVEAYLAELALLVLLATLWAPGWSRYARERGLH